MGIIGCYCGRDQSLSDREATIGDYSAGGAFLICRSCGVIRADLPNRRDVPMLGPAALPDHIIRHRIREASKGRLKQFARDAHVSLRTLRAVIDGERDIPKTVAEAVGLKQLGFYDPDAPKITLLDANKGHQF